MTSPPAETRTVLLVAADPALRTVAQLHLATPDLEIAEASDQEDALELLRRRAVRVAIGRLHGGRFDGLSFVEALRRAPDARLRELPVLLVTDADADGAAERAAAMPRTRVLLAPLTGPRLACSVRELLASA